MHPKLFFSPLLKEQQTNHKTRKVLALSILSAFGLNAHAQLIDNDEDGWSLGVGGAYASSIFKGENDSATPFPYIAYDKGPFHIGIDGLSYQAVDTNIFSLAVTGNIADTFGTENKADSFATIDRGTAFLAGIESNLALGPVEFNANINHDISGEYDGSDASLSISTGTGFGRLFISGGVGAKWQDEDTNLYLYGVKPHEATAELDAFAPETSITPYAEFMTGWVLSEKSMIIGALQHEELPSEITLSPLVDKDTQDSAMLIYVRKF